jgi:serine/threonine protein kinase
MSLQFAEIRGDKSGRVWLYHRARPLCSNGVRYRATAEDDGSFAVVHLCSKEGMWLDELERLRSAIAIASRPEIAAAPTIRRLLDIMDTEAGSGEFDPPGRLVAIWEWADITLDEFLQDPDQDPASAAANVEANVGAALEVLHGLGIVHLDVAPNNVFRVDGTWKLGDLDSSTERGSPACRQPLDERYLHPDRREGIALARDEFDFYGLARILEDLCPEVAPH